MSMRRGDFLSGNSRAEEDTQRGSQCSQNSDERARKREIGIERQGETGRAGEKAKARLFHIL